MSELPRGDEWREPVIVLPPVSTPAPAPASAPTPEYARPPTPPPTPQHTQYVPPGRSVPAGWYTEDNYPAAGETTTPPAISTTSGAPSVAPSPAGSYDVPAESQALYSRVRQAEGTAKGDGYLLYGGQPFTPGTEHPETYGWKGGTGPTGRPTHAAGPGQWQKGTWDGLKPTFRSKFGRDPDFSNSDDQRRMVWLKGEERYGPNLAEDIKAGKLDTNKLAPEWEGFKRKGADYAMPAMVAALKTGNPDNAYNVLRQTSPGMNNLDTWGRGTMLVTTRLLQQGKVQEAEAVADMMFRVAHAGTNMHLMGAYAALQRGDMAGAAAQLDRSYAFFPDGGTGQFMTDKNGQLFGRKVDETTGQPIGPAFPITPDTIMAQMKFTRNPVTFQKVLADAQKATMDARYRHAQIQELGERNLTRQVIAAGNQATSASNAQLNAQTRIQAAGIAAGARTRAAEITAAGRDQDKQPTLLQRNQYMDKMFEQDALAAGSDPVAQQKLTKRKGLTRDLLDESKWSLLPDTARTYADGIANNQFTIKGGKLDGKPVYAVMNPRTGQPVAYLPHSTGLALEREKAAQPAAGVR